ncbi:MAG TPA: hypothetical protein VN778_04495, partial [Verrucomicrobiae bacterium]|nr:hypothetical protein [Verrucomicrobiae bacterium]
MSLLSHPDSFDEVSSTSDQERSYCTMRANSPKGQISQIWTPNPGKFWRAKLSLLITLASAAAMLYLHRWCVPTAVVVGASFYMYAA